MAIKGWRKCAVAGVCGFFLTLAGSPPGRAQGVFDMGVLTNTLSQPAGDAGPSAGGAVVRQSPTRLTYRPDAERRRTNLRNYADGTTRPEVVTAVRTAMRGAGLNPDNVADAMALYLATAWHGSRGNTDATNGEYRAIGRQLTRLAERNTAMRRLNDAQRQNLAEVMMLQSLAIEQQVGQARQSSNLPAVQRAVAEGARKTFKLNLVKMRLDDRRGLH